MWVRMDGLDRAAEIVDGPNVLGRGARRLFEAIIPPVGGFPFRKNLQRGFGVGGSECRKVKEYAWC